MTNYSLNRTYSESIRQFEKTDKADADVFNPVFQQLINNDASHKDRLDGHDTQLAAKANQSDLNTTNQNVSTNTANIAANTAQLAEIAQFATSNGTNDNTNFVQWIANSNKIYIPPNVTLKLGYTTANTYIDINKPIKIYGGGTIEFIGDFTQTGLFRINPSNVRFKDINFINNTGTMPTFNNGFVNTLDGGNVSFLSIRNCTVTNGCLSITRATNCTIKGNTITNGFILAIGGISNKIEKNNVQCVTSTTQTGPTAINLLSYAGDTTKDWYIGYNTITNICWSGITLQNEGTAPSNSIVEKNTLKVAGNTGANGNLIPISIAKCVKVTVQNNDIFATNYNGHYYGIESVDSSDCLIEGNRIEGMASGIIVNGTATGLSFNNTIKNNTILNWLTWGIHLYNYTRNNLLRDNVIKSNSISSTVNVYGIHLEANAQAEFTLHQCLNNVILIDGSALSSVVNVYGIRTNAPRCKVKDNVITVKSPKNAWGIYMMAGDNYGMNYGKNMDVSSNEIIMSVADVTNAYATQIYHTGTNDLLTNTIIQYNRANTVAPSSATVWQPNTAYTVGQYVIPPTANGNYYKCTTAGTSGASVPTWQMTPAYNNSDNTVTWTCYAGNQLIYTSSKVDNGVVANNFVV